MVAGSSNGIEQDATFYIHWAGCRVKGWYANGEGYAAGSDYFQTVLRTKNRAPSDGGAGLRRAAVFRGGRQPASPAHEWSRKRLPRLPIAACPPAGRGDLRSRRRPRADRKILFAPAAYCTEQFLFSAPRFSSASFRVITVSC